MLSRKLLILHVTPIHSLAGGSEQPPPEPSGSVEKGTSGRGSLTS